MIAHSHNASAPGIVRKLMDGVNRPRMKHYVNEKFACSEKAGRWLFGDKAFERGEVDVYKRQGYEFPDRTYRSGVYDPG